MKVSTLPQTVTRKSRVNQTVTDLPPSGIRRFFDLVISRQGVISLGVGEPDFVTPWHICEAGIHSLESGRTSYTSNSGLLALREEISLYLEKNTGNHYD
ncbi:MAG: pyridoxal phosphate-dependent aminotransferase, partial [Sphingopyxis terrae]